VFCGRGEQPTWQFAESLLVPVEGLAELELRAGRAHLVETELVRLGAEHDRCRPNAGSWRSSGTTSARR
jgi:hypothetical protein